MYNQKNLNVSGKNGIYEIQNGRLLFDPFYLSYFLLPYHFKELKWIVMIVKKYLISLRSKIQLNH